MTPDTAKRLRRFSDLALNGLGAVFNSYACAERAILDQVPGDLVECGVFAGTQVAAMALACQVHGDPRRVHLYDSFQGIPIAGPKDGDDIVALVGRGDGSLVSSGKSACSADQVRRHMDDWGIGRARMVFHEGWFQDTVPGDPPEKIAVLRLDGDLYESTIVCLRHLYPRLAPGGWCIIDDWGLEGCRQAVRDALGQWPFDYSVEIPNATGARYWQVPWT